MCSEQTTPREPISDRIWWSGLATGFLLGWIIGPLLNFFLKG